MFNIDETVKGLSKEIKRNHTLHILRYEKRVVWNFGANYTYSNEDVGFNSRRPKHTRIRTMHLATVTVDIPEKYVIEFESYDKRQFLHRVANILSLTGIKQLNIKWYDEFDIWFKHLRGGDE